MNSAGVSALGELSRDMAPFSGRACCRRRMAGVRSDPTGAAKRACACWSAQACRRKQLRFLCKFALAKEPSRTSAQPGGDLLRSLGKIDGRSPAPPAGTVGQDPTGPGRRLFPYRIDSEGAGDDLVIVALGGARGGDVERDARV